MRTATLLFLGACLLLTGCARHYVLKMTNGVQVTACSKPKLDRGFYVFKDSRGQDIYVSQGRVLEIVPASRAGKETSRFKPEISR